MSYIDFNRCEYCGCWGGRAVFYNYVKADGLRLRQKVYLNKNMCLTNEAGLFCQKIHPLEIPDLNLAEYFDTGDIMFNKVVLTDTGFWG